MDLSSTNSMVIEVLQRASSQNPEILKPAEGKLKEWETQPGFYTVLYVGLVGFCFMGFIIFILFLERYFESFLGFERAVDSGAVF